MPGQRSNVSIWLALVASGCGGGDGPASALRSSLESHKPPLVDHITGPLSAYYADKGIVSVLCGDDAKAQAQAWEQEFADGARVCVENPPLILCNAIDSVHQREFVAAFDEASSRLVGIARAPMGAGGALGAWLGTLGATPTCP